MSRRSIRNALLVLPLALAMTGCFRMTFYTPLEQPQEPRQKIFVEFDEHGTWHHATLWGIVDLGAVDVSKYCGDAGVAQVHMRTTFLNGLAGAVALNTLAYAPQTVQTICAPGGE